MFLNCREGEETGLSSVRFGVAEKDCRPSADLQNYFSGMFSKPKKRSYRKIYMANIQFFKTLSSQDI